MKTPRPDAERESCHIILDRSVAWHMAIGCEIISLPTRLIDTRVDLSAAVSVGLTDADTGWTCRSPETHHILITTLHNKWSGKSNRSSAFNKNSCSFWFWLILYLDHIMIIWGYTWQLYQTHLTVINIFSIQLWSSIKGIMTLYNLVC